MAAGTTMRARLLLGDGALYIAGAYIIV